VAGDYKNDNDCYMYASTTAITNYQAAATDIGTLLGIVVASVLVGWAALTGLGFGISRIKKFITGRRHF